MAEKIIHIYNSNGLHAFKKYDIDSKCCSHILEWKVPETNIVESHWYNEQDKLEEIFWNNSLDDHGSVECLTFDGCRKFKRKSVFINDAHGHPIEFHEESASPVDRSIHFYYKNEFDERENLIVHTCRDQEGHLHFRHMYRYDDTGNIIEKKAFKPVPDGRHDNMFWDNVEMIKVEYY